MTKLNYKISVFACLLTQALSQRPPPSNECDKYCFQNCDQYLKNGSANIFLSSLGFLYFHPSDACQIAKDICECDTRFSIRNPILWIALSGTLFAVSVLLYLHHASRSLSKKSESIPASDANRSTPSPPFSDWYTGNDYQFRDKPPDYVPPPSYNDISKGSSPSNVKPAL